MAPAYRVNLTLVVAEQLQEIFDYIEKDSPQNAHLTIKRLLDAVDRLALFPRRFKVVENNEPLGDEIRSMPVRPYLVRYHINESAGVVTIVSVRHGARRQT